jgi:hypothetical protein
VISQGQRIRFTKSSRFNDWHLGDLGEITRVLALPPQNQKSLYVIKVRDREVWATAEDFTPMNQLSLF